MVSVTLMRFISLLLLGMKLTSSNNDFRGGVDYGKAPHCEISNPAIFIKKKNQNSSATRVSIRERNNEPIHIDRK